ncbi:MAG: hypothetical protein WC322_02775 [Candidatus Paceibacterota bacterium]|jgi:hypothetical protein
MKTNHDWSNDEFFIGRFPGIGKSLSTTKEEHIAAQAKLELQKAEYFARGGSVTLCPPMALTPDVEYEKRRKAIHAAMFKSNLAREAA